MFYRILVIVVLWASTLSCELYAQVLISVQEWNGENFSAFGYRYNVSPANNSQITVELDHDRVEDWVLPKLDGYLLPIGDPYVQKATGTSLSLPDITGVELNNNFRRSKWVAYFHYSDGVDGAYPGSFGSPSHTGHFGQYAYGNIDQSSSVEFTLRAEIGDESKCLVSWISSEVLFENDWDIEATLFNSEGIVQDQVATRFSNGRILTVKTLFIDVQGKAVGDYLVVSIKTKNINWLGSALYQSRPFSSEELPSLPFTWRRAVAPALGWITDVHQGWFFSTFMKFTFLGHYPWIYQQKLGWLLKLRPDFSSHWYFSPQLGYVYVNPDFNGWFSYTQNGSQYIWEQF